MVVRKPLEKMDIEALISNGAKVKEDLNPESKKWSAVNLRISSEMLKEVDLAVSKRIGISRTGWILEAIHQKLQG